MSPTDLPTWKTLSQRAKRASDTKLHDLIHDGARNEKLRLSVGGIHFDFSKQRVDATLMTDLLALARETGIASQRASMLRGEHINASEDRAVLHAALRGGADAGAKIDEMVREAQTRMRAFASRLEDGQWRGTSGRPITDVVHIGIGGSHLGPELVVDALRDHHQSRLRIHFVANIDANDLHRALQGLDPETTLFIVASKSFSTLETKVNALTARSWFIERTNAFNDVHRHFVGITTNVGAATEFGLDENNLFPLWDWVGGRYSLWSTVGLPILLSLGEAGYDAFLDGAREVHDHFANTPDEANIPILAALLATWNTNFLGAGSLAVLSYDERLRLLPEYLQQLEMESNGKAVDQSGNPVSQHTMPILWGGTGTRGQHAYHQLLHQGTRAYAADYIVVAQDDRDRKTHHNWLLANALAQAQAMAVGFEADTEPHRAVPGNRATTTMVLDALAPSQLGAWLAVYEHKVFCQGVICGVNSFDQWGVELGKQLAVPIYDDLARPGLEPISNDGHDESTRHLIDHLRATRLTSKIEPGNK